MAQSRADRTDNNSAWKTIIVVQPTGLPKGPHTTFHETESYNHAGICAEVCKECEMFGSCVVV